MSPRKRGRVMLLLVGLLGLLSLAACALPGSANIQGTPGRRAGRGTAVTAPTPIATPRPAPTPGPLPIACPLSHATAQVVFPELAPVIGTTPVWATWPAGETRIHLTPSTPYPSTYEAPYGWLAGKIIWEVGPQYTQPVTVRGNDLYDHTPLYLQFSDSDTPTAVTVLDPKHPDHAVSVVGSDWAEWGVYLVIPKAGCYRMEVSWPAGDSQPAGHWDVTFAAGA